MVLQVPVWDMLNHITGQCNVRLHHNSRKGALQMITACAIAKGEELVNNYGPLSDSELLRRFGFVEPRANPNNGCELPLAMLLQACRSKCEIPHTEAEMNVRVSFLRQHKLVPSDGWFKTDAQGQPSPCLIEAIRILLLTSAEYSAFRKQVDTWRCPLSRPLATLQTVSLSVHVVLRDCVAERHKVLASIHSEAPEALQTCNLRAAEHVVCVEREALRDLHAWTNQQDQFSLAALCRQVWQHVRALD